MIAPLLEETRRHPRGWPIRMAICGAYELRHGLVAWEATHVISIHRQPSLHAGTALFDENHLQLEFDDVADPSRPGAPTFTHLATTLSFIDSLPPEAVLVVHCAHGISRSTALALGILAREVPPQRAAALLHGLRPFACPNPLMVRLWDELLGFEGALVEAARPFPTMTWQGDDRPAQPPKPRRVA